MQKSSTTVPRIPGKQRLQNEKKATYAVTAKNSGNAKHAKIASL